MGIDIISCKIALDPTPTQQEYFWQWSGTARYVYNYALNLKERAYKKNGTKLSSKDIMKIITGLKAVDEYDWLNETPSETIKYAVKDMEAAFKAFFRGSGYPRFKSKKRSVPSFYTRYDMLKALDDRHIQLCGTTRIEDKSSLIVRTLERCIMPEKPLNPRIKHDGKYWYLTFGVEVTEENKDIPVIKRILRKRKDINSIQHSQRIGIDLGIHRTAYLSNGVYYTNINKDQRIQKLEHRLELIKRIIHRKYAASRVILGQYKKSKNIERLERKARIIYRSIKNKRNTLIHNMTTSIVKIKPSKIVIERLSIKSMMKNKHLSKSIQNQKWYEFQRQLEYKCRLYGIQLSKAPRMYPSSKICSQCGAKKEDLTLSDRMYKCNSCGLCIDRDLNAALNLSRL